MQKQNEVTVIGAGLAGCEAAWQLTRRGIPVRLCDMKPGRMTAAHHYEGFAELVCSNSLHSDSPENASGLLKREMRLLNSLVLLAADASRVPAGSALAVDRRAFSDYITRAIRSEPLITVCEEDMAALPTEGRTIVATGPLTSDVLAAEFSRITGEENLFFFDAAAPIIAADSIDYDKAFFASRYGQGSDYLNCPMDEAEYRRFYEALVGAECAELRDFEYDSVFEGCMPVEAMARRGEDTLRFGPLRPVGLKDPRTGKGFYAVVQLRREDEPGTMYNLVGFQTHLKFPEQRRVFSFIPGLENMEILRYGVMHRNTYLCSPKLLDSCGRLKTRPNVYFAGQLTGVEGYMESAAGGLVAGITAAADALGMDAPVFGPKSVLGALMRHISASPARDFQPMNANYGIVESLPGKRIRDKRLKARMICERSLAEIEDMKQKHPVLGMN